MIVEIGCASSSTPARGYTILRGPGTRSAGSRRISRRCSNLACPGQAGGGTRRAGKRDLRQGGRMSLLGRWLIQGLFAGLLVIVPATILWRGYTPEHGFLD